MEKWFGVLGVHLQGAQSAFDHRCYVEYEAKCAKHIKIQSRLLWVFFLSPCEWNISRCYLCTDTVCLLFLFLAASFLPFPVKFIFPPVCSAASPLPTAFVYLPSHRHHHLYHFAVSSADHRRSPAPAGFRPEPPHNEMPTPYAVISGLPGCQQEQLGNLPCLPKPSK